MEQKIIRRRGACHQCKHRKIRCEWSFQLLFARACNSLQCSTDISQGDGGQPACGRCHKKSLKCQYQNPRRAFVTSNLPAPSAYSVNVQELECSLPPFQAPNVVDLDLFLHPNTGSGEVAAMNNDFFERLDFDIMSELECAVPPQDQDGHQKPYLEWTPGLDVSGSNGRGLGEDLLSSALQHSLFSAQSALGSENGSYSSRDDEVSAKVQASVPSRSLPNQSRDRLCLLNPLDTTGRPGTR
jgi:hypothetical protein